MAAEQPRKVEMESPAVPAPAPAKEARHDVVEEKSAVTPAKKDTVADDSKSLSVVEKTPDPAAKTTSKGSIERHVALAELEKEKRLSFIKAWEESEKTKVENKTQKKLAEVNSWENTQKAKVEAKLKKVEDNMLSYEQEELEKKKAEYAEKMKNKAALIHKEAEEKRAMVEARRGEELLKAEEMAAKHRATGHVPKKVLGCFGG